MDDSGFRPHRIGTECSTLYCTFSIEMGRPSASVDTQCALESTTNQPFFVKTSVTACDGAPTVMIAFIAEPVSTIDNMKTCLTSKPEYRSTFSITLLRSKHKPVFASYNSFGSLCWPNGMPSLFGATLRTAC